MFGGVSVFVSVLVLGILNFFLPVLWLLDIAQLVTGECVPMALVL